MDFSNNRKRPRNFVEGETERIYTKISLNKEIQKISKCVEIKVTTTEEPYCVYEISDAVKYGVFRSESFVRPVRFITVLLEEIKHTFKDCDIKIDPYETNVIIDWS